MLVSASFLASHPYLRDSAIEIAGQALATDSPQLFESRSAIELIGSNMTRQAAASAYKQAHVTPIDVSVMELHDCFTTNQMCAMEDLGLASQGQGWRLVEEERVTYDKNKATPTRDAAPRWIINPSGGLISKGHPLGATGLAQCSELVWHLRGWASTRSVPNTKYCLAHNMGLGGATVVTIYKRADGLAAPDAASSSNVAATDGRGRLGYNPAVEARAITRFDWERVRSGQSAYSPWASAKLPWMVDSAKDRERAKL